MSRCSMSGCSLTLSPWIPSRNEIPRNAGHCPRLLGFVSPEPRRLSVADLIRVLADFRISTNLEKIIILYSYDKHRVSPGISYRLTISVFHCQHLSKESAFPAITFFLRHNPTKECWFLFPKFHYYRDPQKLYIASRNSHTFLAATNKTNKHQGSRNKVSKPGCLPLLLGSLCSLCPLCSEPALPLSSSCLCSRGNL